VETIQTTYCKHFDNSCYHQHWWSALMMITGVIETFAICRLYRLHWRWFSLQGYLALPLFVYQSSVRFDIKQFGALAVFHEKWSKRRFQHNAANARLRTEGGLRSRFQGISLPCSFRYKTVWGISCFSWKVIQAKISA